MEDLFQLAFTITLITVAYMTGSRIEKKHFADIKRRELAAINLSISSQKKFSREVTEVALVTGSVVVGQDYFKQMLAGLKNFFGGRVTSYESLLDRGRREAILRMKEKALKSKATEITNFRVDTTSISSGKGRKQKGGTIEIFVYGTAGR